MNWQMECGRLQAESKRLKMEVAQSKEQLGIETLKDHLQLVEPPFKVGIR